METPVVHPEELPVSKNARKKLAKQKKYEETKEQFKKKKKEKAQRKKVDRREAKRKAEEDGTSLASTTANRRRTAQNTHALATINVIIDCSFDELMTHKEITSMSSQLTRCHSDNRNAEAPVDMHITSFTGRLKIRMEDVLAGQCHRWKGVSISSGPYIVTDENRSQYVYLTADAEETLDTLEQGKTYIIGGIIDRNRHKGICYRKSVSQNIRAAKLPIGDYMKMSTRHVLTINQVLEIMLNWLESSDWLDAFRKVIPQRKMPSFKPTIRCSGTTSDKTTKDSALVDEKKISVDANQGEGLVPDVNNMDTA